MEGVYAVFEVKHTHKHMYSEDSWYTVGRAEYQKGLHRPPHDPYSYSFYPYRELREGYEKAMKMMVEDPGIDAIELAEVSVNKLGTVRVRVERLK